MASAEFQASCAVNCAGVVIARQFACFAEPVGPDACVTFVMQTEQEALAAAQAATGEQQRRADAAEAAHSQAAAHAEQLQGELDHMRVRVHA